MSKLGRPSDEEALRVLIAYYSIVEPEKRAVVLELVEKYARESTMIDGVTHFNLLDRSLT